MKREKTTKHTTQSRELGEPSNEPAVITKEQVQQIPKGKQISENSDVLWTMTAQQSADLRALHDSIQLGSQHQEDNSSTPESPPFPIEDRPQVGSDEWRKRRRESHKLVERKRREAISDGINELARIVPGCEKNKGSILNRAVSYIKQLKEQELAVIERASIEKMLNEQTIHQLRQQIELMEKQVQDLTSQKESMRHELEITCAENDRLKGRFKPTSS